MMRGYLREEERYRKCFVGPWYLTGDLAMCDADGYYWFIGRADDVIKSSGHLIGPFEVESTLMEHPAVAEAGVIGKPDPMAGEIVKAFVALNPWCPPRPARCSPRQRVCGLPSPGYRGRSARSDSLRIDPAHPASPGSVRVAHEPPQSSAGADAIQVTIYIELEEIARSVARAASLLRLDTSEPCRREVKPIDEGLDKPHRVLRADIVVQ